MKQLTHSAQNKRFTHEKSKLITINADFMKPKLQISKQQYKQSIIDYEEEQKKELEKSKKRLKKSKKFSMWFGFIMGTTVIFYETIMVGYRIKQFGGWVDGLVTALYILIIALWGRLIYHAFKQKAQFKTDKMNDMLEVLEK